LLPGRTFRSSDDFLRAIVLQSAEALLEHQGQESASRRCRGSSLLDVSQMMREPYGRFHPGPAVAGLSIL